MGSQCSFLLAFAKENKSANKTKTVSNRRHCRKSDRVHIVFLTEGSKLCWWMTAGKHSSILLFSFLSPLPTFTITAGLKFGRRTQLSEVATTPRARLNKIVSEPQRNIGNRPTVLPLGWQVKCAERRIASFQHVWMVTATSLRYQVARILRWFSTVRHHWPVPGGSCLILELNMTAADVRNLPPHINTWCWGEEEEGRGAKKQQPNASRSRSLQHALLDGEDTVAFSQGPEIKLKTVRKCPLEML